MSRWDFLYYYCPSAILHIPYTPWISFMALVLQEVLIIFDVTFMVDSVRHNTG